MRTLNLHLPDALPEFLPSDADACAREVLQSAVLHWFAQGVVSQGWASEFLGISRAEFLDLLFSKSIPASNLTSDEILAEVERALAHRQ